jgi:hypothetical protein
MYAMTPIEKITMLLARKRIDQVELEARAKLPAGRVSKWATTGEPTGRQALRIARVLCVPVEWLIDDESLDEPPEKAIGLLTDADRAILQIVREKDLTLEAAIHRLLKEPPESIGLAEGDESDPQNHKRLA